MRARRGGRRGVAAMRATRRGGGGQVLLDEAPHLDVYPEWWGPRLHLRVSSGEPPPGPRRRRLAGCCRCCSGPYVDGRR